MKSPTVEPQGTIALRTGLDTVTTVSLGRALVLACSFSPSRGERP